MKQLRNWFDFLKITIASSTQIKAWGTHLNGTKRIFGLIQKSETIFPGTLTPVPGGLFCSTIFGPLDSKQCLCGQFFSSTKQNFCHLCKTPRLYSGLRRSRMGYIQFCRPILHIWYLVGVSNLISNILNITSTDIEKIVYGKKPSVSFSKSVGTLFDRLYYDSVRGAAVLKHLLISINLKIELIRSRMLLYLSILGYSTLLLKQTTNQKILVTHETVVKRIRLLENFISSKSHPSWLILENLPVLPPVLRPLFSGSTNLMVSDLNKLYLTIIHTNSLLKESIRTNSSARILTNNYIRLQKAVDCLIDSNDQALRSSQVHNSNLMSLSSTLEGKFGRLRYNLLGKRVDASGRSVIAVGPSLKLNQCGLPFKIAVKLFEPFLIRQLLRFKVADTVIVAKNILTKNDNFIWLLLVKQLKRHLILVNRAPTLHRLGLQAFEPVLSIGDAILFPPLICNAFNADFDGDQMSIYLPFTLNSQRELQQFLYAPVNLTSVTTGSPSIMPSHEMIIGTTFLTLNSSSNFKKYYNSFYEVLFAFNHHFISLHTIIWVKVSNFYPVVDCGNIRTQFRLKSCNLNTYFRTTMGRLLLNKTISNHLYL